METKIKMQPRQKLEDFADEHGLTLKIHERPVHYWGVSNKQRFYAKFPNVEEKDGCILRSISGSGFSQEEAILQYERELSGKAIVIDAMKDKGDYTVTSCTSNMGATFEIT